MNKVPRGEIQSINIYNSFGARNLKLFSTKTLVNE